MAVTTQESVSPIHAGRTITLKAFLASELPEDVRERVVEKYRWINVDYGWWEFILDDFIAHIEEAYGATLEREKVEFDLYRRYVNYNGKFCVDVNTCKDKVEMLKEIYSLIATVSVLSDRSLVQQIRDSIDNMEIIFEGSYGGWSISYSDVYDDEQGYISPFDVLAEILDKDCTSFPDELESELEALIEEEFRKLLYRLQSEWEWLTSDECVVETLNANGFLFTEDGERIPISGFSPFIKP